MSGDEKVNIRLRVDSLDCIKRILFAITLHYRFLNPELSIDAQNALDDIEYIYDTEKEEAR